MPNEDIDDTGTDVRVQAWRLLRLSQLGFASPILDLIAESNADLHVTERLLEQGCPLDVAAQIVL